MCVKGKGEEEEGAPVSAVEVQILILHRQVESLYNAAVLNPSTP